MLINKKNVIHTVYLAVSLPIAAIAAIAAFTPGSLGIDSDSTAVTFLVQAGLSAVAVSSLCIALRSMNYYGLCKGEGDRTPVGGDQSLQGAMPTTLTTVSSQLTVSSQRSSRVVDDLPPPYSEVVINAEPTLVSNRPPSYSAL